MRPQSEVYNDVVAKVDQFPEVLMSYLCCHYINRNLTVEVDLIFEDEKMSIMDAQNLAKKIQKEIGSIKDIHHADVMINLTLQSLAKEKELNNMIKQQRLAKAKAAIKGGLDAKSMDQLLKARETEYPRGRPGHMWTIK